MFLNKICLATLEFFSMKLILASSIGANRITLLHVWLCIW